MLRALDDMERFVIGRFTLALAIGSATLTGCSAGSVDQSNLCIASTDEAAKKCSVGHLFYFQPQQWGNEQLPLNVMAAYCDFNHQIIHTNGGVMCVFTDKRLHLLDPEK